MQSIVKNEASGETFYDSYSIDKKFYCSVLSEGSPGNCKKVAIDIFKQNTLASKVDYVCIECLANYFPLISPKTSTNLITPY